MGNRPELFRDDGQGLLKVNTRASTVFESKLSDKPPAFEGSD
jgi:hypothetical protein